MFDVQKSPVERDVRQLNRQEAQKPVACNIIPKVLARLRRHLGFFYIFEVRRGYTSAVYVAYFCGCGGAPTLMSKLNKFSFRMSLIQIQHSKIQRLNQILLKFV